MGGMLSKRFSAWRKSFRATKQKSLPCKPVLSCVVDQHPKFLMQVWIWLISAKESGTFDDCQVVIHHVGHAPDILQDVAKRFGTTLVEVDAFGEGEARYCNKLQSHVPIMSMDTSGAILTDVDLFFLSSPIACLGNSFVQSKIVDHPNPSSETLSELAETFDMPSLTFDAVPSFGAACLTHEMNCNGGLYALSMKHLKQVAPYWRNFSSRCLSEKSILGRWLHHSDQIGFLMAMIKLGVPFRPLDLKYNFPTHFSVSEYEGIETEDIRILHYHDRLDRHGRLIRTGHAGVDAKIDQANGILLKYEYFPEYKNIQALYAASL